MSTLDLLLEAERRGILPDDKRGLLEEARRRGLAPSNIDFERPVEAVRADIDKLEGRQRERALEDWADAVVEREREAGGIGQTLDTAARTLARGTLVGSFLDEANAAGSQALHSLTGGRLGAPYDEAVAYQRAKDRAADAAHPVLSTVGKIAGGVAGGFGAVRGLEAGVRGVPQLLAGPARFLTPAATGAGRIRQAALAGGTAGVVAGFGEGEGVENRLETGLKGGALGAVLGTGIGAGAETLRGALRARANVGQTGAYNRFVDELPDQNIDTLANQIATGAARNNQSIQRRTLDILGEEMERAVGNRGAAVKATVDRIVAETGVAPATARDQIRRLTQAQAGSRLMLAEYPAVADAQATVRASRNPQNIDLQEVGRITEPGTHFIIDDLANSAASRSSAIVRSAVRDRNEGMRDAVRETLEGLAPRAPGGTGPRTIVDLDQMQEGARRAAAAEYQAAYSGPTNTKLLVGLLPRIINRHAKRMAGRAGEQADALRKAINEFMITRPNGQRLVMMDLQMLQDARGALRVQIDTARRAGQNHIVHTLTPLYRGITRLMERANPAWARANRRWAEDRLDTIGRELGEALSLRAGPKFRKQLQEYHRLAPEAQDMVRVEFLQKLYDRLDNLGDTHDVSKLFTNNHMRHAVETLFGRQGVIALVQAARDAKVASTSGGMLRGSQTAMRQARRTAADAETGIMAAMEIGSAGGVRRMLIDRLANIMRESRNVPLAEIATTPVSDTAAVARHLHNMRRARAKQQQITTPSAAPVIGSTAVGTGIGQLIGP